MKLGIKKNPVKAKKLINANAIFLDEGGQLNMWYLENLEEILQDLMGTTYLLREAFDCWQ